MPQLTLTLCFLFTVNLMVNAQQPGQDAVHLHNGEVYKGIIIEQRPGSYLTLLKLPEQDTLRFFYTEIDKLTKEVIDEEETPAEMEPVYRLHSRKVLSQIHYYIGGGDYSLGGIGVTLSKPLGGWCLLGGGVHYIGQVNDRPFVDQQLVAIAMDFKLVYAKSANEKRKGYLSVAGGYYFPLNSEFYVESENATLYTKNTFYLNPSIAFHWEIFKGIGFMIDLGYQLTTAEYFKRNGNGIFSKRNFNNIAIRGSLTF